jgi:hypothetical protein
VIAMKKTSKCDDWAAVEYAIEVLNDVRKRLRAGADGPGATLTADECVKVLACLKNPPNPAHARKRGIGIHQFQTAMFCFDLEDVGTPVKNAVAKTMQHFDCSRSTVLAARGVFTPQSK